MSALTVRGDAAPLSVIALLVAITASSAVIAIAAGTASFDAPAANPTDIASPRLARSTPTPSTVAEPTNASATNAARGTNAAAGNTIAAMETCAPQVAVVFAHGRTTPPVDVASQLAPVIAFSRTHPERTIVVDGHADPSGTELENLMLSKRRARRVADALVQAGVPAPRIVVRAFGAYVPVVGEPDAGLRRVQVAFHADPCRKEAP